MADPERPKGFLSWWPFVNEPSFRAAPYRTIFIGGFAIALALLLMVLSPGTILGSVGLLLLGALGIFPA